MVWRLRDPTPGAGVDTVDSVFYPGYTNNVRTCPRKNKAFTLIELMLVVAIIGLLAAIALPKFSSLIRKAQEASIMGKLGALRSAISIYYADKEGIYPTMNGIAVLTEGSKYIDAFPSITIPPYLPDHRGNLITFGTPVMDSSSSMGHTWHWGPNLGEMHVACTHTDTRGSTWSDY